MIANTPTYLFRRFRADQSVKMLADAHSAVDLLVEVKLREQAEQTLLDQVVSYACLVALSFKPPLEVEKALALCTPMNLDWAEEIVELFETLGPRSSLTVLEVPLAESQLIAGSYESAIMESRVILQQQTLPYIQQAQQPLIQFATTYKEKTYDN